VFRLFSWSGAVRWSRLSCDVSNGTQVVECLESLTLTDVVYCHVFVSDVDRTSNYIMQNLLPRSVCVRARVHVCIGMYVCMLTYAICCLRKFHKRVSCRSLITAVMPFFTWIRVLEYSWTKGRQDVWRRGRGVRQECCLSPILFSLYSECIRRWPV